MASRVSHTSCVARPTVPCEFGQQPQSFEETKTIKGAISSLIPGDF